ncbi:RecQ family ATP-dependent DNA helicase [Deinococcus aquatilis]|uniref:RecQ family ATP-dependent DNA helicase n=1 Tax=Deinococcus aquatilis TaxID=519440 RepID=UPI001469FD19|nr:RecQ family ATP-dependent DNA helicase [Deinococcus aquatilis]
MFLARDVKQGTTAASDRGSFVIFDLETIGSERQDAQIIQLAALRIEAWQVTNTFNACVSGRTIDELTESITGLTQAQLDSGQPIETVVEAFLTFTQNLPLAGHNVVTFDVPILQREAQALGFQVQSSALDTLALTEILLPHRDSYRLEDLIVALEGQVHERAHQADADVDANYRLLLHLQQAWHGLSDVNAALLHATGFPELALLPERSLAPLTEDSLARSAQPVRCAAGQARHRALPSREVFRDGGLLSQAFTRYEARPTQVQMADCVEEILRAGGAAMIEAPTGTGKTKAYLVPAAAVATSGAVDAPLIIVSTHTKALQGQALQEVRELNELGIPFKATVFKGISSYLCPLKLEELRQDLELGDQERRFLAYLLRWVQTGRGDLEEVHGWWMTFRSTRELIHQVRTDQSLCSNDCPFHAVCAFQDRNRGWEDSHVIITNHAATFTALPARIDSGRPRPTAIVFDEAHNLEDAARSAYTVELESTELSATLAELARAHGGYLAWLERAYPQLHEPVKRLRGLIDRLRTKLSVLEQVMLKWAVEADRSGREAHGWNFEVNAYAQNLPSWPLVYAHVQGVHQGLRLISAELRPLIAFSMARGRGIARRIDDSETPTGGLLQRLDLLLQPVDPDGEGTSALILTVSEGQWTLAQVPLELRPVLGDFFREQHAVIWTSATLRLKKSFDHLRRVLAVDDLPQLRELALEPVLPYHQAKILLPWHLPPPSRAFENAFVTAYAIELSNALKVTNGRSLVLFASRDRMNRTYLHTSRALQGTLPVLAQGRGPRENLIRTFKEDVSTSLFGLRSMMEGVDVPGESLMAVHLEKIPFPVVGATERALQRYYTSTGRNWWEEYYLPRGIIPFVQSFGRLIRSQGDRGAFVVWDRRISGAFYWDDFVDSLPVTAEQLEQMLVTPIHRQDFYAQLAQACGLELNAALVGELQSTPAEEMLQKYRGRAEYSDQDLEQVLLGVWGHEHFRPTQLATVRDQLQGQDVLLILPTGGGKSLTFQLPALLSGGLTVVISPLISLMQDQHGDLLRRGVLSAAALYGGLSLNDQQDILRSALRGEYRLLYLSPERLFGSQELRAVLQQLKIERVVIDEAHCVSMWGHGFRPEYLLIREALDDLQLQVPITAVTATATAEVEQDILNSLGIPHAVVRRSPVQRRDLTLRATRVGSRSRRLGLLLELAQKLTFPALIYCATVKEVVALHALLEQLNLRVGQYHGQLTPFEREETQDAFLNDDLDLLVATKAFGMGVNKPNIRQVIHYQLPDALESYVQEVGRGGRDQGGAIGTLLYSARDEGLQQLFIDRAFPSEDLIERVQAWIQGEAGSPAFDGHVLMAEHALSLQMEERELQMALHALRHGGVIRTMRSVPAQIQVRVRRGLSSLSPEAQGLCQGFAADPATANAYLGTLLNLPDPEQAYQQLLREPGLRVRTLTRALSLQVAPERPDWRPYVTAYLTTAQRRLQQLVRFAASQECRHVLISRHFGEPAEPCVDHCDNCAPQHRILPSSQGFNHRALLGTRRVLRQIVKYCEEVGAPVGRQKVLMIARGLTLHQAVSLKPLYLRCPAFGKLETLSNEDIEAEIRHMLLEGKLYVRPIGGRGEVICSAAPPAEPHEPAFSS